MSEESFWLTNEFKFISNHKSIKFWSYSRPFVTGLLYCDKNCATEEHGDSDIASGAEVSDV